MFSDAPSILVTNILVKSPTKSPILNHIFFCFKFKYQDVLYNSVAIADLKCLSLIYYTAHFDAWNRRKWCFEIGDLVGDFTHTHKKKWWLEWTACPKNVSNLWKSSCLHCCNWLKWVKASDWDLLQIGVNSLSKTVFKNPLFVKKLKILSILDHINLFRCYFNINISNCSREEFEWQIYAKNDFPIRYLPLLTLT